MFGTVAACEKLRNLDIGRSATRGGVGLMLYQDAPRVGLADQMPLVAIRAAIKLSRTRCHHRHHSCFALGIDGVEARRWHGRCRLYFKLRQHRAAVSLGKRCGSCCVVTPRSRAARVMGCVASP